MVVVKTSPLCQLLETKDEMMLEMLEASTRRDDHKDSIDTIKCIIEMYNLELKDYSSIYKDYCKHLGLTIDTYSIPLTLQQKTNTNKYMYLNHFVKKHMRYCSPAEIKIFLFLFTTLQIDPTTSQVSGQIGMATIQKYCGITDYYHTFKPAIRALERRKLIKILKLGKQFEGNTEWLLINPHSQPVGK